MRSHDERSVSCGETEDLTTGGNHLVGVMVDNGDGIRPFHIERMQNGVSEKQEPLAVAPRQLGS